jgi:hypothetical protein
LEVWNFASSFQSDWAGDGLEGFRVNMRESNNNYKNRRLRGQCATCKKQSARFRCDECREKFNSYIRDWRFEKSIQKIKQEIGLKINGVKS